jgi:hypothetical protein
MDCIADSIKWYIKPDFWFFSCMQNSDFNIYISQYDLACVQAGFIGAVILHPDRFGIARPTANELSDYVFFWRGIGYLLGIDDDHNICSRGLAVAREICLSVEDELAFPGLYQPSSEFHRMADAYIDGINGKGGGDRSFRMFSKESLIAFWFYVKDRHMSLLPSWLQLSYSDYMRLWVLKGTMFMLKWCPGFERLFNWYILNYVFKSLLPLVEKQLARRN